MAESRHYKRAPITEAVVDLRVASMTAPQLALLERVGQDEAAAYPARTEIHRASGQMELGQRVTTAASSEQIGFRFAASDQKLIWQARTDGFTVSRLAPYDRWETLRDESRRLWTAYRRTVAPDAITRLALRYINRFDIPGESIDLRTYFRTSPEISPDLPQSVAGFFLQLQLPQEDLRGQALINETIIPPPRAHVVSVVLDIDLFRDQEVPQDEDSIWDCFEQLHVRKNEVFEACITDEARRIIS